MDATRTDASDVAVRSMMIMAEGTMEDFRAVVHPDAVNREAKDEPPATRVPGPDGFYATALWLRSAFADLDFEVHETVVDSDLVVVHCTMSGRHTGTMVTYDAQGRVAAAMPATGKPFAVTHTHWLRLRDGLVIEHWANRDDLEMGFQLGWVPPSPIFLVRAAMAKRRARSAAKAEAAH